MYGQKNVGKHLQHKDLSNQLLISPMNRAEVVLRLLLVIL